LIGGFCEKLIILGLRRVNAVVLCSLNKQRRSQGVPEIDEPEMMEEMGKKYLEKTLIRDTVKVSF
jgi:hypothetical protein